MKDAVSGFGAALMCVYIGFPFDIVKTRMQSCKPGTYKNIIDCGRQSLQRGGVLGLYRGATPALTSALLENSVLFTANGFFLRQLTGTASEEGLPLTTLALAGGLAGIFSSTAITPPEVIKVRLQVSNSASGPLACVRSTIKQDGVRGLFRGLPTLWLRDIPFNIVFLAGFEASCRMIAAVRGLEGRNSLGPVSLFCAGGTAGIMSWAFVFPADVVKTHVQSSDKPITVRRAVAELYAAGGASRFYRGVSAACLRAFPANAGLFVGYELTHRLLHGEDILGGAK